MLQIEKKNETESLKKYLSNLNLDSPRTMEVC